MSKRAPEASGLLAQRTAREREWCYEMWMRRMSFRQIRAAANLSPEEGGLGYDLSVEAVRNLVAEHRTARGDVALSRDERAERMSDEIDMRARNARRDLELAYTMLEESKPTLSDFRHEEDPAIAYGAAITAWAKQRELAAKLVENADRRLDAAQQREERLHGLAAPTRVEAEVTHHDGATAELAAMLAEAGVEVPEELRS